MAGRMDAFEGEPDSTREAIMQATYDALAKHGYADLTIQRIGDEFDKSKSLLYHHYESKDALLIDFLGFMLEQMEADVPLEDQPDARQQLEFAFDHVFDHMLSDGRQAFVRALVELRAQGAHDETYRDQITANERFLLSRITGIVESGVEEGTFRDVDPERVAEMLLTVVDGAILRHSTVDDADLEVVHEELAEYVRLRLLPGESAD